MSDYRRKSIVGRGRWLRVCLGALVGLIAMPACQRSDETATSKPAPQSAPAIPVALDTPQAAARTVLTCLRALHDARARRDQAAAADYERQLVPLAAREVILKRYGELLRGPASKPDEVVKTFVSGWGAIVDFYVDGLKLDQMQQVETAGGAAGPVSVLVPASAQGNDALIRLECAQGSDKLWRIARIDFATKPPASQLGATQPASSRPAEPQSTTRP